MNKFKSYWKSLAPDGKKSLSLHSGVNQTYISALANSHNDRKPGWRTISKLVAADPNINYEMFDESINQLYLDVKAGCKS
jgi:type II secretory pathway component PulL